MYNLILLITVSLSLNTAESLAVKRSPEMISMYHNMLSLQSEYKSLVYSFIPSLYIKGNIPDISYYSDDLNYPGSSVPIPYWERYENRGMSAGMKIKTPLGGEARISYNIYKREEYYNLYENRKYYEKSLEFNITQPFGLAIPNISAIKSKKKEIELYEIKMLRKKREISKRVINDYIDLWMIEREKKLFHMVSNDLSKDEKQLDYLYANKAIDKMEYLKAKLEFANLLSRKMEMETNEYTKRHELAELIGNDSFRIDSLNIDSISGKPLPLSYYDYRELAIRREVLAIKLSEMRRKLFPGVDVNLSLGLNNRGDSLNFASPLSKNSYGISLELNIPLPAPVNYSEISAVKHKIDGLDVLINEKQKLCNFQKERLLKEKKSITEEVKSVENSLDYFTNSLNSNNLISLTSVERYELFIRYIEDLEIYGNLLKKYYIIKLQFESLSEGK